MPAPPGLCGGAVTGKNAVEGHNIRILMAIIPIRGGSFR